jgi:hypothetical protein
LFVNGVEQTRLSSQNGTGTIGYTNATNRPFRIGNDSIGTFAGSLNGKIAYLAVYKGRVLTTSEMNQLDAALPLPVNSTDLVQTITPGGSAVTVTTTVSGEKARLLFLGKGWQQATVQLSNNTIGSVTVSLLKPDNTTVLNSISSSAGSFTLPQTWLPMTGTYTISIQPNGSTSGSITAAVTLTNAPSRPAGSVVDPSNPLSTSLAGLFLMNEGSGTTDLNVADGQTASFSGTSLPTWNTTDPSVTFNGGASLASYLNAGTDLAFDQLTPGQMTVVGKIYVSTLAAAGVCEKNDGDAINSGFSFGWDSTGALKLQVETSSADVIVATNSGTVQSGGWVQVAFTWDGTSGASASNAHLFVNGVEQTRLSSQNGTGTIGYTNATNKPFRIGNDSIGTFAGSLNGKIAYLAVYKGRVLTTSEMNQLDAALPLH